MTKTTGAMPASPTFEIQIVLRERDYAISEHVALPGPAERAPSEWTDQDVEYILKEILLAIDRAKNPGGEPRFVALRGFSWIVEPVAEGGVVIAIEIPMGAAVAGPFAIDQPSLDRMVRRVLAAASPARPVVH